MSSEVLWLQADCHRSALAVDVLVAVEQGVDVVRRDARRLTELARDVHRSGDVLAHDGSLDGGAGVLAAGEDAEVAHQDGRGPAVGERVDDAPPDGVVADQGERPDRDVAAELVSHHREYTR